MSHTSSRRCPGPNDSLIAFLDSEVLMFCTQTLPYVQGIVDQAIPTYGIPSTHPIYQAMVESRRLQAQFSLDHSPNNLNQWFRKLTECCRWLKEHPCQNARLAAVVAMMPL